MLKTTHSQNKIGILYALAAYGCWGLFPIYWSFLKAVPSLEILSHRILWSFIFYLGLLFLSKKSSTYSTLKQGFNKFFHILLCAIMISTNWLLYVWAVNNGHVLETSLGYFINPLVNVGLGFIFLKERLNRAQTFALFLAFIGVLYLTLNSTTGFPWIALTLALTFGLYGLFRKTLGLETLVGSTLETLLLLPVSFIILLGFDFIYPAQYGLHDLFNHDIRLVLLLIIGGAITGIPLLFFSEASKRLRLSTLGFFQYLAPTLQFLCAVFFFSESFTPVHAFSYSLIWIGIAINLYSAGMMSRNQRKQRTPSL